MTLVSISEAEVGAAVVDPRGRAPALPFGHLNPGWNAFLAKRQSGWKLWRFEIPGQLPASDGGITHRWSVPRGRKIGYAWAKWKRVEAEFISDWD